MRPRIVFEAVSWGEHHFALGLVGKECVGGGSGQSECPLDMSLQLASVNPARVPPGRCGSGAPPWKTRHAENDVASGMIQDARAERLDRAGDIQHEGRIAEKRMRRPALPGPPV